MRIVLLTFGKSNSGEALERANKTVKGTHTCSSESKVQSRTKQEPGIHTRRKYSKHRTQSDSELCVCGGSPTLHGSSHMCRAMLVLYFLHRSLTSVVKFTPMYFNFLVQL